MASLDVTVTGVADVPSVTVADAAGAEDSAIALDITAVLTDVDGSETITDVTISGVPLGAQLSAGTDNLDGTWTLTPADLAGLTVTPAADSDADFTLSVSATSTEAEGDAATTISNLDVTVAGVADVPTVTVAPATGAEDQAIALDIGVALNDIDGSETITDITVAGVPSGAQLSAGTDNLDGTWTLTPADLAGLTVTPPADSDADFTLTVSATATEADGDTATTLANLDVTVTGVADVPTVTVAPATGAEDTAIPLDITAALADTDGSETLGITIAAVPLGAILSAGTDNGDGTWTLTGAELFGLTITPPAESADDFTLGITVTATDEGGDTATTTASIDVAVTAVADAPTLDLDSSAAGAQLEDTVQGTAGDEIPLDMSAGLTDTDLSETLSITISGVPEGATLSAGFDNGDGSWTLTGDDLAGLTITSPDAADFELSVSATATEAEGDTATTTGTIIGVSVDTGLPTEGDDVFHGTPAGDVIDGLGGNDLIFGEAGNDTLTGGTGSDFVSGGEGDDTLDYSVDGEWGGNASALNSGTSKMLSVPPLTTKSRATMQPMFWPAAPATTG